MVVVVVVLQTRRVIDVVKKVHPKYFCDTTQNPWLNDDRTPVEDGTLHPPPNIPLYDLLLKERMSAKR